MWLPCIDLTLNTVAYVEAGYVEGFRFYTKGCESWTITITPGGFEWKSTRKRHPWNRGYR